MNLLLYFTLCFLYVTTLEINTVKFESNNKIQSLYVPISKDPVLSWMDVQEGIYPNISSLTPEIKIGNALTILIYVKDTSKLYDVWVSNCIAYDNEIFDYSENYLALQNVEDLTADNNISKSGFLGPWSKVKNIDKFTTLLHSNFMAFKFPDKERIYLTCNIKLCYGICKSRRDRTNEV